VEDIISAKTRKELREYFVGTSLRIIEDCFDSANIFVNLDYHPGTSGQRRTLVEQYYSTLDFASWKDVQKLLSVFEEVLIELEIKANDSNQFIKDTAQQQLTKLIRYLNLDGFQLINGKLIKADSRQHQDDLIKIAGSIDAPLLHSQINRINNSIGSDPELAVGTSKELVETTCKTILQMRSVSYNENSSITELVKTVRKELQLLPEDIPESSKGADAIKKLLSGLGTITQGLSEIRNLYGTGHGKDGRTRGINSRHAKLAVGAATTLALFLWETHENRKSDENS
jgi:hypothetical protein